MPLFSNVVYFFALLSFFLFGGPFQLFAAACLHGILVGDTNCGELKGSILVDIRSIENHLIDIAGHSQLQLKIHQIIAHDANSSAVLNYINQLVADKEDVIFFYFSGHGFRTPSKEKNPWPNIYFATDQTGIDLLEIGNILKAKAAHLSVVFADCCNSSLPNYLAPPLAKGKHTSITDRERITSNIKKLYIETDGLVMIASSKAGQASWSIGSEGSLYTGVYSEAFKSFVKQRDGAVISWQSLLDLASYKTYQTASRQGVSQDPIYEVAKR